MVVGTRYLAMGTLLSLLLTAVLLSRPAAFDATFPLELPFFAIFGSMGGLVLFGADRSKGVFEYLISYGVSPRRLYGYALLACVALATVVLGAATVVGLGGLLAQGDAIGWPLEKGLLLYAIPMTYACSLFAAMVSMIWSALASPRAGSSGPIGFAPLLGVGPAILVLVVAETAPPADYYLVTSGAAVAIIAVVALLAVSAGRLLSRERLLSPM